jgi:hypothetical protein
MFLTYYMVKWGEVEQAESDQRCALCGRPLMKTEPVIDPKGASYVGYVCHPDKQVTWVKVS